MPLKALGGNVDLYGDSFDEANRYAINRAETEGLTFIPPYDDEFGDCRTRYHWS